MPRLLCADALRLLEASVQSYLLALHGGSLPAIRPSRVMEARWAPVAGLLGTSVELATKACLAQGEGRGSVYADTGAFKYGSEVIEDFVTKVKAGDAVRLMLTVVGNAFVDDFAEVFLVGHNVVHTPPNPACSAELLARFRCVPLRANSFSVELFEHYDGETGVRQIMRKSWVMQPVIALLTEHVKTFEEFPPRQEAASLNINEAIDKAKKTSSSQ